MTDREAIECMQYLDEHQHSTLFKSLVGSEQREIITGGIRLAISALREREERSKGCVYCEQAAPLTSGFMTDACISKLKGLDGKVTYALRVNGGEYRAINYCPMCGRELKGATQND